MSSPPSKKVKVDSPGNNTLTQLFSGFVGVFIDQGIGKIRCGILQKQFQSCGGVLDKILTSETTHVFVKGNLKFEKILKYLKVKKLNTSIHVVDVEWLSGCLVDGKKQNIENYLIKATTDDEDDLIEKKQDENFIDEATNTTVNVSPVPKLETNKPTKPNLIKIEANKELFALREEFHNENDSTEDQEHNLSHIKSEGNSKIGFWACAVASTSKPTNLNEHITDKLEILEKSYEATQDQWRARAYKKAIKAIKNHPTRLNTYEEVVALPFVGDRLANKIKEIIETGHLRRLDHIDPKVQLLDSFAKVWGAGPKTAEQWIAQGYKTVKELEKHPNLTTQQKIGLKYYDDINERMPRSEVAEIEQYIRAIAERLLPEVLLVVCGSYRRGRATCGDIDILVSHKDNKSHMGFLLKLLDQLKAEKFITNDLITVAKEEQRKYMGLIKLPGENRKHRRIDFIVAPFEEWACALMHFTGSAHFNRSIRLLAKKKNMSLSEHALRINVVRSSIKGEEKLNKGEIVTVHTEKDIFDHFGLDYLEPTERDW